MRYLIDCFYFLNSACVKGKNCQYRHCEEAKSTQFVCPFFKENKCFAVNCKFRHPKNKQENIPCVYENKSGGCRRYNCFFLHKKTHFKTNPYVIDPALEVQTEGGEKTPQIVDASSEELMKIHELFKQPDVYTTAYNDPARKTPQCFKYKKENPHSASLKKTTVEFQHIEKINQGNSKSLNFKIKTLEVIKNIKKQNEGKRKFVNETEDQRKKLKFDNGIVNKEN